MSNNIIYILPLLFSGCIVSAGDYNQTDKDLPRLFFNQCSLKEIEGLRIAANYWQDGCGLQLFNAKDFGNIYITCTTTEDVRNRIKEQKTNAIGFFRPRKEDLMAKSGGEIIIANDVAEYIKIPLYAHELGHSLGVEHTDSANDPKSIMLSSVNTSFKGKPSERDLWLLNIEGWNCPRIENTGAVSIELSIAANNKAWCE